MEAPAVRVGRSAAVGAHRRASINDVARQAGVSTQTVSRVLNNHPLVAVQTRAKINQAIHDLGYRPSWSARSLVKGETRLLGVIISGRTSSGPSMIAQAIEAAAAAESYAIISVSLSAPHHDQVRAAGEQLLQTGVDGIVVVASAVPDALIENPGWPVPVVVVQGRASPDIPTVGIDEALGAALAVRHLLEQGHAQVWHVGGPASWTESQQRADGWRTELRTAGVTPPRMVEGDWTAASGYNAGLFLSQDPSVTAVFTANDEMAAGVQAAYRDAGQPKQGDLAIVGFGDHPVSAYLYPPLTTVLSASDHVGSRVMDLLKSPLQPLAETSVIWRDGRDVMTPRLVVRSSSSGIRK